MFNVEIKTRQSVLSGGEGCLWCGERLHGRCDPQGEKVFFMSGTKMSHRKEMLLANIDNGEQISLSRFSQTKQVGACIN